MAPGLPIAREYLVMLPQLPGPFILVGDFNIKVLLISSVTCPTLLGVMLELLYFVFISYLSVLNWITVVLSIVLLPLVPSVFWTLFHTGTCAWRLVHFVLLL